MQNQSLNQLNTQDKKIALPTIFAVSAVAILFLFWLIYFKQDTPLKAAWVEQMPWINASFNGISTVCLLLGLRAILGKNQALHQRYMLSAFVSSSLFLVSYIIYHTLHGDTLFVAQGLIRPIYFFILLTKRFELHRKLARITFPLWLYVSVTGVVIVFMLKLFNVA